MKTPVSDASVAEYAKRLRAGGPLGQVFPNAMSECAFTEQQREEIRKARLDRRRTQKSAPAQSDTAKQTNKPTKTSSLVTASLPKSDIPKASSKLRKMLYLQSGLCFFCGEPLKEEDASIEHLYPKSRGGKSAEDNEVVCHKSLNETFGALDLKRKFAFVLKSAGSFRCPEK
jgi:5-methylcytosine-specific restriction endonuclease McrA